VQFPLPNSWGGVGERLMLQGKDLKIVSKLLRKQSTPWEQKLWYFLRGNRFYGLKFKRQVPFGQYVADFCCQEKKIIIELDGGQHALLEISEKDKLKQQFFEKNGYAVLRFWNNDIDHNMEGVLETIRKSIF
jgi:very-short-patch-repair endonuclease